MGSMSSWLGGYLFARVFAFVSEHRLGWVFPQETGMAIWPNRRRVRKPDLTFIRRGRLKGGRPNEGWLLTVPDLVVEVVSPRDQVEELELKLEHYREAEIPVIWVIYPATRRAHVLGFNRPRVELGPDGVLEGESILPGFSLPLAELFAAAEPEE